MWNHNTRVIICRYENGHQKEIELRDHKILTILGATVNIISGRGGGSYMTKLKRTGVIAIPTNQNELQDTLDLLSSPHTIWVFHYPTIMVWN